MEELKEQYGRVKGAGWFPLLYKKDVLVLGQGGIGSWVTFLLSRIGCNLHIYDMDTYEAHNMTGQLVGQSGIGKPKTEAMIAVVKEMSPDCDVFAYGEYKPDSDTNDIVICGFDNMAARKIAFTKWVDYVVNHAEDRSKCFFQDGRLLAEQLQIFSIPGDREDLIKQYNEEYLFDDSEAIEAECTFKQTSHCAAMIASHMVGFLTSWISNNFTENKGRFIPPLYQYYIPLNLTS